MSGLSAGASIGPSVRLVRPLKAGGMGEVWIAEHAGLQTEVVVKFLSTHLVGDSDSEARFSREAAAAARVKSPHVVHMLDHGVFETRPYIVMELLEGEDLAERLHRDGKLALRTTVTILSQVGRALARAHERGVIHRDIKPANIFLCEHGGPEPFV